MESEPLYRSTALSPKIPCTSCDLYKTAKTVCVQPRGSDNPIVLFVGEGPGKTEDSRGSPFIGASGKKLDELMQITGLNPKFCRWTNIARCVPWESVGYKVRPPNEIELDACSRWIETEILQTNPIFIVPLGAAAASYFLQKEVKIGKVRGKRFVVELPTARYRYVRMREMMIRQGIEDDRLIQITPNARERAIVRAVEKYGFKDIPTRQFTLFPMFHPAAILYGYDRAQEDILSDMNYLVARILGLDQVDDYRLVTDFDEAINFMRQLRSDYRESKFPYLAYDVEATSLRSFEPREKLITFSISTQKGTSHVFPWDHHDSPFKGDKLRQDAIRNEFNKTLEEIPVCNQNLKYDYEYSHVRGIYIRKIFDDTLEMAWTLFNDQSPKDLDYLTSRYTDLNLPKQEMREAQEALPKEEKHNMDNYDLELLRKYNGGDTDSVVRLEPVLRQMLIKDDLYDAHQYFTVGSIIPTIEMEINGTPIDQEFHAKLKVSMETDIQSCYDKLDELGTLEVMENFINDPTTPDHKRKKFNLASSRQVSDLLFEILGFKPVKLGKPRKKGSLKGKRVPSSDKHVMLELFEEASDWVAKLESDQNSSKYQFWRYRLDVVNILRDYNDVKQDYKMYVKNLPSRIDIDGYVRCNYGIRHTASGRFNCRDPSLHTLPWHSKIKKMFVSRFEDGLICSVDHAQMELRMFAMCTQDPALIQAFVDKQDIHRLIASRVKQCRSEEVTPDERRRIKTVVFGLLYGRGPRSIAAQEGITKDRAISLIRGIFSQFPLVKKFVDEIHAFIRTHGFVRYINGFRRIIPIDPSDPSRAERQAVNTVIQGPSSDMCIAGMINMNAAMKKFSLYSKHWEFKHDDLGFDVAPGELMFMAMLAQREMVRRVADTFEFARRVPLKVDFEVGVNWGQSVEMSIVDNTILEFSGEEVDMEPLLQRLLNWETTPIIIKHEVEVKEKTAKVRSLMRSSGEMVEYNHITAQVQFPKFKRREPVYTYPPFVEVSVTV